MALIPGLFLPIGTPDRVWEAYPRADQALSEMQLA
jgi:hypothetical protein